MNGFKFISIILLALFVTACGNDPQDASEENFENAINRILVQDPLCIKMSSFKDSPIFNNFNFPDIYRGKLNVWGQPEKRKGKRENIILIFVEAGLVQAEEGEFEQKNPFSGRPEKTNGRRYSLTDRGNEVFKDKGFCYGIKQVVEITNYTEPNAQMGQSAIQVQYTYIKKITDDWIRNDAFKDWVKEVEESADAPRKGSATLVLTKKGWFSPWELR